MQEPDRVNLYIAPWALPRENIPIHVQWKREFSFQTVRIDIPEGFGFVEFVNLDEVKIQDRHAIIEKNNISKAEQSTYFGCIIRCVDVPKSTTYEAKIVITFYDDSQAKFSTDLKARIFRPQVGFVKAPAAIELNDDISVRSLPLYLSYTGFGDIQLQIQGRIGGTIVSGEGSVAYEILKRLWLSEISDVEDKGDNKKKETLTVAPEYVRNIAGEVQRILETGEIPSGTFDKEVLEAMKKWLGSARVKNTFMELFYSRIEDLLLSLLVDILESHPATNVKLADPRTRISTQIRAPVENLTLSLRYRDLLGNEYEPVNVSVKVIDQRTQSKSAALDIPIVIDKWDDRPLLNVAGV